MTICVFYVRSVIVNFDKTIFLSSSQNVNFYCKPILMCIDFFMSVYDYNLIESAHWKQQQPQTILSAQL